MIFFALPFLFIPFVIHFKAGLVLYWATTNLWTVGQGIVTRRLVPRTKATPQKKSSRTPPREDGESEEGAKANGPEPKAGSAEEAEASPVAPRKVRRKKKRSARR
jgi:YidC/Oxa1 family membrane protein insertase